MTRDTIKTTLRKNGFRVTDPRVSIFTILENEGCNPKTADEIRTISGLDKVTVYRTLESFAETKLITRVEFGDGVTRYEITHGHHHHIVCMKCGAVCDVENCMEEGNVKALETKTGFTITSHVLEFFGVCIKCQ